VVPPAEAVVTSRSKPPRQAIDLFWSSGTTPRLARMSGGAQILRTAENQRVECVVDGTVSTRVRSGNASKAATTASDRVALPYASAGQRLEA